MRNLWPLVLVAGAGIILSSSAKAEDDPIKAAANLCHTNKFKGSTTCKQLSRLADEVNEGRAKTIADPSPSLPSVTKPPAAPTPAPTVKAQPTVLSAPVSLPRSVLPLFAPAGSSCVPLNKAVFVRADPLDNYHYLIEPPSPSGGDTTAASAKGASISYTDDRAAGTQTATINGRVSVLTLGSFCNQPDSTPNLPWLFGFGLAPFVDANGTWNEPIKNSSTSALQTGVDIAFGIGSAPGTLLEKLWQVQYFYVSPFHQTDFQGVSSSNGVAAAWEPQNIDWHLGVAPLGGNPYLGWSWQFRAQAQWAHVDAVGYTNQTLGDHETISDIVRVNLSLLPGSATATFDPWVDSWIIGRFSFIGTMQNFRDVVYSRDYNYYTASLAYKLGPCTQQKTSGAGGAAAAVTASASATACKIQGSSSISLEYDWGTDPNTLVFTNQYLIKLNYAY